MHRSGLAKSLIFSFSLVSALCHRQNVLRFGFRILQ
ncbi:unnamed protein product [Callosobruchus maculatus]|uniref:Lipoprotein n=1 Tax=Callosobruchus maculatus TaxID=64391 RepID=A0A653CCX5_CALMS|nr:unnamed protein product [Callosobruchus maculatus]